MCIRDSFHVWPVDDVDDAIALLTGVPAGEPNAKGEVPEGTVNHLVASRLAELSLLRQAWGSGGARTPERPKRHRPKVRHRGKRSTGGAGEQAQRAALPRWR